MDDRRRPGYAGGGAGMFAPDGCAVEIWRRLPPGDEARIVADAVPPPARLLELGCGAGRMTRGLLAAGFAVTAVDESAAMLAEVGTGSGGAETVLSPIEELDLGRTFDGVLLASFLAHAPDPAVRAGLLAACRRHVRPGGTVLIQREGADWHDAVPRTSGPVTVVSSTDAGDGVREVHVVYDFPDGRWTHTFRSRPLTAEQFAAALADAGLSVGRVLTTDGTWVAASPAPSGR